MSFYVDAVTADGRRWWRCRRCGHGGLDGRPIACLCDHPAQRGEEATRTSEEARKQDTGTDTQESEGSEGK